jgi:UDP-N-acetylglucosamine--N-acetylmuramyl-(pentapeptide) pyrophosphoryl-undecaprenol N-acetylglucosamine transferase
MGQHGGGPRGVVPPGQHGGGPRGVVPPGQHSVVIAGGGTGGHIEPALALADALRRADPGTAITCLGTERGLETRLVPMRGYDLALIPPVPLPRSLTPALLSVPSRLKDAVGAAAAVLDQVRADVLVGFGGYVAAPGYLAARRRGVPIVVHEANSRPGLANRLGALFAADVCTGQRGTRLLHARYVGIPIRREIAGLDRLALADKARAHFGLEPDLPVLLVTGGSQGAASLNRAVLGAAGAIRAAGVQVLHIAGPRAGDLRVPDALGVRGVDPAGQHGPAPYVVLPYLDRMDLGYAAADFALCRAGAMTCAELSAIGLPAIYVPLPHGNGEQRLNALPIEAAGGGKIVPDAELTPDWIIRELLPILLDGELVAAMSRAAASVGNPNADTELAAIVIAASRARARG